MALNAKTKVFKAGSSASAQVEVEVTAELLAALAAPEAVEFQIEDKTTKKTYTLLQIA